MKLTVRERKVQYNPESVQVQEKEVDLELTGRRVVIIGSSQSVARAFAREKCSLVLVARHSEELQLFADRLRVDFDVVVDLLSSDLQSHRPARRFEALQDIDVLVNNSGLVAGSNHVFDMSQIWGSAADLEVYGYISLCREFYEKMKSKKGGVIINNIAASPEFYNKGYTESKRFAEGFAEFTRSLGSKSQTDNIRVVGVDVGRLSGSESGRLLGEQFPEKPDAPPEIKFSEARFLSASEFGDLLVLLASPRLAFTSGMIFKVDSGSSSGSDR